MGKKDTGTFLKIEREKHERVIEFAGRSHRSVQDQYRYLIDRGMDWEEKITREISQQLAFNVEAFTGKKQLIQADHSTWNGIERRKRA